MTQNGTELGKVFDRTCDLDGVTKAILVLTEKIDTLIQLNRDIIKWLLVVVCIIALGRSAIDLGKDIFLTKAHARGMEEQHAK